MADHVWRLKQTDEKILYQVYGRDDSSDVSGTDFQRADLNYTPGDSELKLESSPSKNLKVVNEAMSKQELSHDCTEMEINKSCSQNGSDVHRRRDKRKIKKETTSNKNQQIKLLTAEAFSAHTHLYPKTTEGKDLLCLKVIKKENILCPETIKKEDHLCLKTIKGEDSFLQIPNSNSKCSDDVMENFHYSLLHDYFQLDVDLDSLYQYWSSRDSHFKKIGGDLQGVRILRLHPTECLLSFVCSANNHILRISSMVEKLCTHYGNRITSVDGTDYYTFPCLSDLCGDNVESHLRELGFGYRAKYIASIARHVTNEKAGGWLESLRKRSYSEAKIELMSLLGVGAKVADCVCLMSLDKPEALPVDTHIWQLTMKNYIARLHSAKSMTEKIYNEIGDFYRSLWGPYAGWVQAVMFASSLRQKKKIEKSPDQESEMRADNQKELGNASKRKGKQDQKSTKEGKKKKK